MLNKKAQSMFDILIFIIIVFFMVVGFVVFKVVFHTITIQTSSINMPTNIINFTAINNQTFVAVDNGLSNLQWIAVAVIVGMLLNILVSNFLVKGHPAFFMLYVGIVILCVIISVFISNEYAVLASDPMFGSGFTSWTATDYFLNYLPYVVVVVGLLGGAFVFMGILRDQGSGGAF